MACLSSCGQPTLCCSHPSTVLMPPSLPSSSPIAAPVQLLREGKWNFNSFLRSGLLEYLGGWLFDCCLTVAMWLGGWLGGKGAWWVAGRERALGG